MAAGAGINWALRAMRGFRCTRDLGGDFRAGAEAGIEQVLPLQLVQRGAISLEALRLPDNRHLPGKSQPREVFENRRLEFRTAACGIDVLDAQQEAFARARGGHRGERMPQMQVSGWTWRKARDNHGCALPRRTTCRNRTASPH